MVHRGKLRLKVVSSSLCKARGAELLVAAVSPGPTKFGQLAVPEELPQIPVLLLSGCNVRVDVDPRVEQALGLRYPSTMPCVRGGGAREYGDKPAVVRKDVASRDDAKHPVVDQG